MNSSPIAFDLTPLSNKSLVPRAGLLSTDFTLPTSDLSRPNHVVIRLLIITRLYVVGAGVSHSQGRGLSEKTEALPIILRHTVVYFCVLASIS